MSWSSDPSVTGTPAASSFGSGWSATSRTTPRRTFDVMQTSQATSSAASRASTSSSSPARMPCAIRFAPSSSSTSDTLSAPISSPACGAINNPASRAIAAARTNAPAGAACSLPARPNATTPSSAWPAANVATSSAISSGNSRIDANTTLTSQPVAAAAVTKPSRIAAQTSSADPKRGMYPAPKMPTCGSVYRTPCAASSSTSSRHTRTRSSSDVMHPTAVM